jgi:hypothetical protein
MQFDLSFFLWYSRYFSFSIDTMVFDSSFEEEQDNIQKQLDGIEHDEVQAEGNYFTWPKTMNILLLEVLQEQKVKRVKR